MPKATSRSGNPARRDVPSKATIKATLEDADEQAVREVQAVSEGVELTGKAEFFGKQYRLADRVGLMPMLKFAHVAASGLGADDFEGMSAMYMLIRDVIYRGEPACGECAECQKDSPDPQRCPYYDAGDWEAFEAAAIGEQAEGDDLLEFVGEAMAQITARPTSARSGSSSQARRTSRKSKGASPAPVIQGRVPAGVEDLEPVEDLLR